MTTSQAQRATQIDQVCAHHESLYCSLAADHNGGSRARWGRGQWPPRGHRHRAAAGLSVWRLGPPDGAA